MDPDVLYTLKKFFTQTEQSRADLVDPYVVVAFAGSEVRTNIVKSCNHPSWAEEARIAFQVCCAVLRSANLTRTGDRTPPAESSRMS